MLLSLFPLSKYAKGCSPAIHLGITIDDDITIDDIVPCKPEWNDAWNLEE